MLFSLNWQLPLNHSTLHSLLHCQRQWESNPQPGNTKGGSITVLLTSCLTGLEKSVLQIKTKIVSCHTADSKPDKQVVYSTVILPPFSIPCLSNDDASILPLSLAIAFAYNFFIIVCHIFLN